MRIILVTLLLFTLLSCNNKKNISIIDSFKTRQTLTHKVFDLQDAENSWLQNPYSLAVSCNTITAWNPRAPDVFTTIDITTKRIIKHWGTIGQGPNEFIGTIDIYNNYSESGLNVWNGPTGKLYFFSHSNLESDSTYFQIIPTSLNKPEGHNIYDFAPSVIQIDSSMFFVAAGGRIDKRLALLDLKNNEVKEFGDFPSEDINSQASVGARNMAYEGRMRYNSSLKKLVYMSFNSEMFEIYNVINGNDVELTMGNYTTVPKYRIASNNIGLQGAVVERVGNGKGRNRALAVSDGNIFILYQDYERVGMVEQTEPKLYADIVLVFDWNGNPVKLYTLDCFVSWITYDKARNRLWAIHHNEITLDPEIIYFELYKNK